MGCAPSGSADGHRRMTPERAHGETEWLDGLLSSSEPHNMLTAYVELEKSILREESKSPASALSFATARQQQIKELSRAAAEKRDQSAGLIPQDSSIHEIFLDLGLHRVGGGVAAEHEEFIASVNRRALNANLLAILAKRSAGVDESIQAASESVNRLRALYEKQDLLLGRIYGELYGTEKEKSLEEEIDTMRNFRDAFSNGVNQWEDSAKSVHEATELLDGAVAAWRSVQTHGQMERKISLATAARNGIQEAMVIVQMCQDSMPGVQFPYCTRRELTTISQVIEYIFTDIFIEERYLYAMQVYDNFQERAVALWQWINQVLDASLKKDLADIDESIAELSRRLRNERIAIICERLGVENNYSRFGLNPAVNNIRPAVSEANAAPRKLFDYFGGDGIPGFPTHAATTFDDPNLHAEFQRKLAARRSTMWPSRRIEELRTLVLDNAEIAR